MKSLILFLTAIILGLIIFSWPIFPPIYVPPANAVASVEKFGTAEEWLNTFPIQLVEYRKAIKETTLTNAAFSRMEKDVDRLKEERSTLESEQNLKAAREGTLPIRVMAWMVEHVYELFSAVLLTGIIFVASGFLVKKPWQTD